MILAKLDMVIATQAHTSEQIECFNNKIQQIEGKIEDTIEKKLTEKVSEFVSSEISKSLSNEIKSEVKEATEEIFDKQRRATNILLFNLNESKNEALQDRIKEDNEKVDEIFQEIGMVKDSYHVERTMRLGKKGEKARPLKVCLQNTSQRNQALKLAKNLKGNDNSNLQSVGIAPDLTLTERAQKKLLLDELSSRRANGEKDLVIRNSKIVKRAETFGSFR